MAHETPTDLEYWISINNADYVMDMKNGTIRLFCLTSGRTIDTTIGELKTVAYLSLGSGGPSYVARPEVEARVTLYNRRMPTVEQVEKLLKAIEDITGKGDCDDESDGP